MWATIRAGAIKTKAWNPWSDDEYCNQFAKSDYGPAMKHAWAYVKDAFTPEKLRSPEKCAEVVLKVCTSQWARRVTGTRLSYQIPLFG